LLSIVQLCWFVEEKRNCRQKTTRWLIVNYVCQSESHFVKYVYLLRFEKHVLRG